jgi:acyl carrier protein
MESIEDKVLRIANEYTLQNIECIDSVIFDYFDSLDYVEFIMDIEEAFNIEIPDEQAERAKTFADIATIIREY